MRCLVQLVLLNLKLLGSPHPMCPSLLSEELDVLDAVRQAIDRCCPQMLWQYDASSEGVLQPFGLEHEFIWCPRDANLRPLCEPLFLLPFLTLWALQPLWT